MKLAHGILLGGAALVGYNLFARKSAAEKLIFLPGQVSDFNFSSSPSISIGLLVQNTSNQTFSLRSIAGNVFTNANGKDFNIGNFSSFQTQIIPANSQQQVIIKLRLSLFGVVSDLINAIIEGTVQQEIFINGFANIDNWQLPLNFNYKIG